MSMFNYKQFNNQETYDLISTTHNVLKEAEEKNDFFGQLVAVTVQETVKDHLLSKRIGKPS